MIKHFGLIPDTSILFFYIYGNSTQKKLISQCLNFYKKIIINPIIISEVGRTIFHPLFELKSMIFNYIDNKKVKFNIEDFWIDLNKRVLKGQKIQLQHRLIQIITNIRNKLDKYFINDSDPNLIEKQIDRLNSAIYFLIDYLIEFLDELNSWEKNNSFDCPQSDWSLYLDESISDYVFFYNTSCISICNDREKKLKELISKEKNILLNIQNNGKEFCRKNKLALDERLYDTIDNLIRIINNEIKFDFRTKYCWNLGDFIISLTVRDTNSILYTLNEQHFKFLFSFLKINLKHLYLFK